MHDLVLKGGTIADGSGNALFTGDVAIDNGVISDIGRIRAPARRLIDADGLLVTPGFVDIHTHLDAQASWDPLLMPSSQNGVTTVIMGNCGVGFAPCRPAQRDWLIGLMEGVEEIPGTAMHEGIRWAWESFPEYLDALKTQPRTIDIGALIGHGPLRAYVMGARAEDDDASTPEEANKMARLVQEALDAGAFGLSTSRTGLHKAADGRPVPGTHADRAEVSILAKAIAAKGHGFLQVQPFGVNGEADHVDIYLEEIRMLRAIARETGCPVQCTLAQFIESPDAWRIALAEAEAAAEARENFVPLAFGRPPGVMFSFNTTNPFSRYPSFMALSVLPPEERKAALRSAEIRARILADQDPNDDVWTHKIATAWPHTYVSDGEVNYEPESKDSIAVIARQKGISPFAVAYDAMLAQDCSAFLLYQLMNYVEGNLDVTAEILRHPLAVLSGSDAGAHVMTICDGALPTFMLTHWTRDRAHNRFPVEWIVRKQTQDTARAVGLTDRGLLAPGYIADLNLIDYQNLRQLPARVVHDMPGNAPRLLQMASGYRATIKRGIITFHNDAPTGARPGQVLRSARPM